MAVRSSMAAIITRTRLLCNDVAGVSQIFADQDYQDALDLTRLDMRYLWLKPSPTYSGSTISYFDYYSEGYTDWEDDITLSQWRITTLTPSASENIAGHWTFAATTLPPVYALGKTYDVFCAAADMLERLAARWMLSYNINVDGQSMSRSQAIANILMLAKTYRGKQRARSVSMTRDDISSGGVSSGVGLGARPIDYYGSGDGR